MIEIPLTKGKTAIVDDEDAHLAAFRWHAEKAREGVAWYAIRRELRDGKAVRIYLHRAVLGPGAPPTLDHKNRNGLDCRRENLRAATEAQNGCNRGAQKNNISGFKGVSFERRLRSRPWRARIQQERRTTSLGSFATADEAARAYDAAAAARFGEFAWLNFPRLRSEGL